MVFNSHLPFYFSLVSAILLIYILFIPSLVKLQNSKKITTLQAEIRNIKINNNNYNSCHTLLNSGEWHDKNLDHDTCSKNQTCKESAWKISENLKCNWKIYKTDDIQKCFSNKNILILGNSRSRQFAESLWARFSGSKTVFDQYVINSNQSGNYPKPNHEHIFYQDNSTRTNFLWYWFNHLLFEWTPYDQLEVKELKNEVQHFTNSSPVLLEKDMIRFEQFEKLEDEKNNFTKRKYRYISEKAKTWHRNLRPRFRFLDPASILYDKNTKISDLIIDDECQKQFTVNSKEKNPQNLPKCVTVPELNVFQKSFQGRFPKLIILGGPFLNNNNCHHTSVCKGNFLIFKDIIQQFFIPFIKGNILAATKYTKTKILIIGSEDQKMEGVYENNVYRNFVMRKLNKFLADEIKNEFYPKHRDRIAVLGNVNEIVYPDSEFLFPMGYPMLPDRLHLLVRNKEISMPTTMWVQTNLALNFLCGEHNDGQMCC